MSCRIKKKTSKLKENNGDSTHDGPQYEKNYVKL